jgi:hypothetical protein
LQPSPSPATEAAHKNVAKIKTKIFDILCQTAVNNNLFDFSLSPYRLG